MAMQIDGLDEFERKLDDRRVMDELESAMQKTVEFTKEVVVDAVENSGTAKSGKRGRIRTGRMRNSVKTDVETIGDDRVVGKVGWFNDSPEYAKWQELGFNHWISSEFITGMYSLVEGGAQGSQEASKLVDDVARRIFK